jgi:hypothetical protein
MSLGDFRRVVIEDTGLLGCGAESLDEWCVAFRENVMPTFLKVKGNSS